MRRGIAVLLCLSAWVFAGSVHAELAGTLRRIHDSGVLKLGYREQSLPFSFVAQSGATTGEDQPIGFAIDLCRRVVETLELELDRPGLRVAYVPVTSENRIERMLDGAIDIECGSTTNTRARREQVDFSVTFFIARVRMLVRRDTGVKDYDDLAGRKVVVNTGTTAEERLRSASPFGVHVKPAQPPSNAGRGERPCAAASSGTTGPFELISVADRDEGLRLVESRQACAFVLDDVLLAGLAARSPDPSLFSIVGEALSEERYGLMLPRGDPSFKALVDRTLIGLMKSGEAEKLYQRWFVQRIGPGDLNLNLPMSPELRRIFDVPTDKERE
ncbi:MAG: amino acid ABC transporter substrate-binding protein [Burkholderiaceae bacterium]